MSDYKKELDFAKSLAYRAGKIMLKYIDSSAKTVKSNNTPVTEADLEISELLNSEASEDFPDYKVLDEEIENKVTDHEFVWVCDPVDGTIPFSIGVPTSVFSLALCRNKKPVLGVVYDPYLDRLYYSKENDYSYLNGKKIEVNKNSFAKGETILAIPFWLNFFLEKRKFDTNLFYETFRKKGLMITLVESCVHSSMLVASGKVLAAVLPAAYPWDRAAAKIIVENAGGRYLDENGKELTVFGKHSLAIATNKVISDEIISSVKNCIG